jgi:NAD(P)H-dependent FMN reductase
MSTPRIVGIGGTLRPNSSSAKALRYCLDYAASQGATVTAFADADLRAPLYEPGQPCDVASIPRMIEALRAADGVIIASPGYHGGVSGTLKNILDYTEEMAKDEVPYFDGRAVGCLVSGRWLAGRRCHIDGPARHRARATRLAHAARRSDEFVGGKLHRFGPALCRRVWRATCAS